MGNLIFSNLLEMSLISSVVILAVLVIRMFLKKAPKILSYVLWLVVLFRLLCPVSFESPVAVVPVETVSQMVTPVENATAPLPVEVEATYTHQAAPETQSSVTPWRDYSCTIWLLGIGVILLYSGITHRKLVKKLKISQKLWREVRIADHISTPFVLGLFRPIIYLPSHVENKEQRYILAHERHHISRLDHITRFLAFVALTIHWFNPLVWLAFFLSAKDMELSCDEAVMGKMTHDIRADYATSILRFATGKPFVTALGFGESDTKTRVRNVLSYKKPAFWVVLVGAISVLCLVTVLSANPEIQESIPSLETILPQSPEQSPTEMKPSAPQEPSVVMETQEGMKKDYYNILLLGTDESGARSDTMMVARIDGQAHSVALMSVPRDTLIYTDLSIPKINGLYGAEGIDGVKEQLTSILGFPVHGYIEVNLSGFIQLVDALGGVEFDVPVDMHYADPNQDLYIDLQAGLQQLDGQSAMEMVRYRSYATADIGRTAVQQEFLKTLASRCLQERDLSNIIEMAKAVLGNVETDLTISQIASLLTTAVECDFSNLYTVTLPGQAVTVDSAICYGLDKSQVLEIVNAQFNPYLEDISSEALEIRES